MITVYIGRSDWDELKYKAARDKPLPTVMLYSFNEFSEDERDEYVKLKIEIDE